MQRFKSSVLQVYALYGEKGIFLLKFHLFDHLHENVTHLKSYDVISASPFEHFNMNIK